MKVLTYINYCIAVIFFLCYAYQFLYIPVSRLLRKKAHKPEVMHDYAILICARNEENVIGELLQSIRQQTYSAAHISVFVMADNCTDRTADIAWQNGAEVYERTNATLVGKGYALEELLLRIKRDYGDKYDGYFVFDADNLLREDYIEQMNRSFSDGYEILTSYRNSKNYGDNWVSSGYGLWFLRESRYLNQPRFLLGTSCAVSGTGFLFSRKILNKMEGWHYHLLTEDIQFSIAQILEGEVIGFCPDAIFYDEQPTKFVQSWKQRMRWAKGYLQVFRHYGARLIGGMFRGKFACFDMTMAIMPAIALTIVGIATNSVLTIHGLIHGENLLIAIGSVLQSLLNAYLLFFVLGGITVMTEWNLIYTTTARKLLSILTFPLFMFTYLPISFFALFTRVTWQPIEHHAKTIVPLKGKRMA